MDRPTTNHRGLWRAGATSVALALAASASVHALAPIGTLAASQRGLKSLDTDGDGLSNVLEQVHGTSPTSADTDADDYEDAMELALGSDPRDAGSVPQSFEHALDLVAHVDKGTFHLTQLLFAPGGQVAGTSYALSHYSQGVVTTLPPEAYLTNATLKAVGSGPRGDVVMVLTTSVPAALIEQLGPHSYIAVASAPGASTLTMAAGLTLTPFDSVLHEVIDAAQIGASGSGSAHLPLSLDLPQTFVPGQICLQTSVPVGTSGPMVVYEVNDSECVAADAFCSGTSCAGQTGTTFELLDPVALIGG